MFYSNATCIVPAPALLCYNNGHFPSPRRATRRQNKSLVSWDTLLQEQPIVCWLTAPLKLSVAYIAIWLVGGPQP